MCYSYVFSLIAHENSKVLSIFFLPPNPAQKRIILFLKLESHYKFRVLFQKHSPNPANPSIIRI